MPAQTQASTSPLKASLQSYRKRLANFSRRNRELYFKPGRLAVSLSHLDTTFATGAPAENAFDPLKNAGAKWESLLASRELNLHTHLLLALKQFVPLKARIQKLHQANLAFKKEYGISGVWLFGPFLLWRHGAQTAPDDVLVTPIFKMAIEMRSSIGKNPVLTLENEACEINPSLRLALSELLGLRLPESLVSSEKNLTPIEFLREQLQAHAYQSQWSEVLAKDLFESETQKKLFETVTPTQFVLVDAFFLDHLPATRMPLFNDYTQILDALEPHPLVEELLLGRRHGTAVSPSKNPRQLDANKEIENFFVVNTDSSQHEAMDATNHCPALVIQGPPGTGKSQTITNLIADKLSKGKTVLFVAEKRAALDVVYNRLSLAGIEGHAVIVHDSDLDRAALYADILKLADKVPSLRDAAAWSSAAKHLDLTKTALNRYYDTLTAINPESGATAQDLLAYASQHPFLLGDLTPILRNTALLLKGISFEQLDNLKLEVENLRIVAELVPGLENHPWLYMRPQLRASSVKDSLLPLAELARKREAELLAAEHAFSLVASEIPLAGALLTDFETAQADLREAYTLSEEALMAEHWPSLLATLDFPSLHGALKTIENTLAAEQIWLKHFTSEVAGAELKILETYFEKKPSFWSVFLPNHWRMRRRLTALMQPPTIQATTLQALSGAQKFFQATVALCALNRSFGARADVTLLSSFAEATEFLETTRARLGLSEQLHTALQASIFTTFGAPAPQSRADLLSLSERAGLAAGALAHVAAAQSELAVVTNASLAWVSAVPAGKILSDTLVEMHESLAALPALERIYLAGEAFGKRFSLPQFIESPLECVAQLAAQVAHEGASWPQHVEAALIRNWKEALYNESTELRLFERVAFEKRRNDFAVLETKHRAAARHAVTNAFAARWNEAEANHLALNLLQQEAHKKRKVKYPRELMEKGALETMLALKPCWLMSPLSISQVLPMQRGMFDVVIFDEASQVRVEEALPAVFRGQSLVVVGDSAQMPPTNFFSGTGNTEEEEDEEVAESVLDLATRQFPGTVLAWHYRSRSEALIAFSNRAFYAGKLIAPPNPALLGEDGAVEFIEIADATYTSATGNEREANAIVERLRQLLLETSAPPTIGVIAMGLVQAEAIQDAIATKCDADAAFAKAYNKAEARTEDGADIGLFVKNLENVQGDEREVILISIGYAPAVLGGKLLQNFGPLSKNGGRRRLNVATTRAKSQQILFCSFDPNLIDTSDDAWARNPDLACCGRFLKFARALSEKNTELAKTLLDSLTLLKPEAKSHISLFSSEVAKRLRARGHVVDLKVGNSGFFIDLGIRHPKVEGAYLLGIECDGGSFDSTPYARDRDKARSELLHTRGWNVLGIWLPDWVKNSDAEVQRIELRLAELLELAS